MKTVGIQIGASTKPADLAAAAVRAERIGFSEIWLAEDYFELGGIASVANALSATENIPIGLGVVAACVRHPAVTAMEFATVAGAHPGRFMAGLGHGAPGWVRQMGLEVKSPMGLLREATETIRSLLAGDTVTRKGDYFESDGVSLDHPPQDPLPLYYGVQGPASLRLSGELADGTLLGWFSSPGYVTWARDRIDEGRERGSREDAHQVATLCLLSISDDDPDGVSRELVSWAAPMLRSMAGGRQLGVSVEGSELTEFVSSATGDDLVSTMPLGLLRQFAAVGGREDAAATIAGLLDAGADRVVLVPNPAGFRTTTGMLEQMELARSLLR